MVGTKTEIFGIYAPFDKASLSIYEKVIWFVLIYVIWYDEIWWDIWYNIWNAIRNDIWQWIFATWYDIYKIYLC